MEDFARLTDSFADDVMENGWIEVFSNYGQLWISQLSLLGQ